MPRKCCDLTVKTKYTETETEKSCEKEEFLVTPNEYSDFFDLEEVPTNFKELLEIAILNLNSVIFSKKINLKSKELYCWFLLKKAIMYQINHLYRNQDFFQIGQIFEDETEITDVKIGDFSYKTGTVNKMEKLGVKRNLIAPIAKSYLSQCGFNYRGIC